MSKVLNESVGEKYSELQEQFKQGKLTEEQVKSRIIDLRKQVRKPEEVKSDIIKDILNVITEDTLEKFIEEQNHFKIKAKDQKEENIKLKEELNVKKDIEKQFLKTKKEVLEQKIKLLDTLNLQKQPLDSEIQRKYSNLKILIITLVIIYFSLLLFSIYYFSWNTMEQYTFIFPLLPLIISLIYLIWKEKSINPIKYMKNQKNIYLIKTYEKFNFKILKLTVTEKEIETLKIEIEKIENACR